jgi:hypothetical protein
MTTPVPGEAWRLLPPAEQAVTPILSCRGCGAVRTAPCGDPSDLFPSEHCGDCPPWTCEHCGETDSMAAHCGCWIDLTKMALADVKALFAADGSFSVDPAAAGRPA